MKKNVIKILALAGLVLSLGACTPSKPSSSSQSSESSSAESSQSESSESSSAESSGEESSESSSEQSSEESSSEESSESSEESSESSSEQPEEVYELTLPEILTLDSDAKWEHEGDLVKVENLVLQGRYGNTFIGGGSVGNTIVDLRGLQIDVIEQPEFVEAGLGYGADISAEGRLIDVNGRAVLSEATITVNSERVYGDSGYTGGLPMSYCPGQYLSRAIFDGYFGRNFSGALYEGNMQIASMPETLTADAPTYFEVVFPGENLDVEDDENYSLISVQVPNTVSEAAITAFNTFFADHKVGDVITMCACLQYDAINNIGMGWTLDTFWMQKGLEETDPSLVPDIFDNWADAAAEFDGIFMDGMLDLSGADAEDPLNIPFSYLIDDSYLDDAQGYWVDAYKDVLVPVADVEKCATAIVTANFKPSQIEDYFNAIEGALTDEELEHPYELDETYASEGIYMFLQTIEEKVVKEVLVYVQNESSFEIHYTARKFATDETYATFAEAKADYEARANVAIATVTGAAASFSSALLGCDAAASFTLDWEDELTNASYYAQYGLLVEYFIMFNFAEGTETSAIQATAGAYYSALLGAGFKYASFSLFGTDGLFNETSNEFVILGVSSKGPYFYADVIILDATSASYISYPATSDAEMLAQINAEYAGWNGASAAYFPTAATSLTSFTLGELEVQEYSLLDLTYDVFDQSYGYTPYFFFTLTYERNLTEDDLALLLASLTGFVEAEHAVFGEGYFNPTTYEFMQFEIEDNTLTISIGLVASPIASQVITLADAGE